MKRDPRFQLVQTGPDRVHWRLLGANNVSLGAAAQDFARVDDCLTAVGWLCVHLDEPVAEFAHASGGRWRWRLRVAAGPIAVATHAYGRRIEAQRGLERFHAAVAAADTAREVETIADWRTKHRANSRLTP
ncbi:DUF1508 domain-containing protein [Amycolatopsis mediterranei]|uniref:DUF1508 domain-containing protein n=1 Tax=Amycolatopsis mediterranei TaxID=33910 RepID=UPI00342B5AA1